MNEQIAGELITKSLAGALNADDQHELDEYLQANPESRAFAQWSSVIQQAVVDISQPDSAADDDSIRLSELSKERMRRTVREAAASAWLSSPAALVAETATAYYESNEAEAPEVPEETRQAIARFTLIRKIGAGGLGTVWLARDERLRRNVAIKEMNPQAADSSKLSKRFQREAEITGHLEHPNVVPLYLSGINAQTGLPFYAMRFLGKQTLAEAIQEYHARRHHAADAPIHLHRLLNAFLDVCQAIAYAHSRGVIHRDLKPENVALDNFGQVLVLDWGLAKLETDGELATRLALSGGPESISAAHSLDGDVLGTPLYMSPEQAAGDMDMLDERTDVYGLGTILFAILTGVAPHENSSKSHSGRAVKEFLNAIATAETPLPREHNPEVPRELEAICLRAMSKSRFARHGSAEELAKEVESWIAGTHQRQARYDAMRMTGRDLKSRLCVQIRQLAVTAQFMVELPPIQHLLDHVDASREKFAEWRERLSTILLALAKTKNTLTGLSYAQVTDERLNELVRIERSLQDVSNVRGLPASRLRHGVTNMFHKIVMQQFPGEFCIDLDSTVAGSVRVVAGVPVFDARTEEPFGLVLAEAEIGNLVRPELTDAETGDWIYLIDDQERILFSSRPGDTRSQHIAADAISRWPEISAALEDASEYFEADREYYATRLTFPQNLNSIRIVLQVAE